MRGRFHVKSPKLGRGTEKGKSRGMYEDLIGDGAEDVMSR